MKQRQTALSSRDGHLQQRLHQQTALLGEDLLLVEMAESRADGSEDADKQHCVLLKLLD